MLSAEQCKMTKIKEIRKLTGLSQAKFAEKYHIPKRTLENWEEGTNDAPKYVLELLERCVRTDFQIEKDK